MTTCSISGVIADASLEGQEGVRLTFTPAPAAVADVAGNTSVPRPITVTSGPSGAVAVDLVPGTYRVSIATKAGTYDAQATVPDAEAAVLADLIEG
jgi:hypothetical protein